MWRVLRLYPSRPDVRRDQEAEVSCVPHLWRRGTLPSHV